MYSQKSWYQAASHKQAGDLASLVESDHPGIRPRSDTEIMGSRQGYDVVVDVDAEVHTARWHVSTILQH